MIKILKLLAILLASALIYPTIVLIIWIATIGGFNYLATIHHPASIIFISIIVLSTFFTLLITLFSNDD